MPLETKFAQIEAEIAAGKLYQARDRLHGLLTSYPNDLRVRRRLGDVYYALHYPVMAGRYWWPAPPEGANASSAVAAFEHDCGGNRSVMRRRSRPYFHLDELEDGPVKERIKELGIALTPRQITPTPAKQFTRSEGAPCGYIVVFIAVIILGLAGVGLMAILGLWTQ